jgi:hypothetical protein
MRWQGFVLGRGASKRAPMPRPRRLRSQLAHTPCRSPLIAASPIRERGRGNGQPRKGEKRLRSRKRRKRRGTLGAFAKKQVVDANKAPSASWRAQAPRQCTPSISWRARRHQHPQHSSSLTIAVCPCIRVRSGPPPNLSEARPTTSMTSAFTPSSTGTFTRWPFVKEDNVIVVQTVLPSVRLSSTLY